jgi:hypothetical protein
MKFWRRELPRAAVFALCAWAALLSAAPPRAEEPASSRELDVWGRFAKGSWKQTRIISETLDETGKVTATTTTDVRTTIIGVDSNKVTLRINVTVEAGGKRYDTEPQTVQHGYYGEGPNQLTRIRELGKSDLTIDGKTFACRVQEVSIDGGRQKTVSKLFQADAQAPYVLRRETAFTDSTNAAANHNETAEVIMLEMPYKVRSEIKPTAFERSVQKNGKGTTITVDVTSVEVPGGIVMRTLKELDPQGHITRRSTVELVDYSAEEEQPSDFRPRLFHRRRARN